MTVHDPEECQCGDCQRRRFLLLIDPDENLLSHHPACDCGPCRAKRSDTIEDYMRSTKPRTIEISAIRGRVELPPYLSLFQRHFEKASPTVATPEATVNAPVDQLELLLPADLLTDIEEVTVTYRKGA